MNCECTGVAIWVGALILGSLALWVKENRWSHDDTYNLTDAARHGSRMRDKKK